MKINPIDYLEPYDESLEYLNVVVETPKGSRLKYSYNQKNGMFIISKVLPEGMVFPYNFGFVPGSLAADGDPLDVLVLNEEVIYSNTLLKVRPIAVIKATQVEEEGAAPVRNDRIIGQAVAKEPALEFRELKLEKPTVNAISIFFETYNRLHGKKFNVLGVEGPEEAQRLAQQAVNAYRDKKDE